MIDLGVRDPVRFRGWSGGNKASFTISDADATPSYLPGPLPAGAWKNVLTGETVEGGKRRLAELLREFPVALLTQDRAN